ncbi:RNA-binding protein rnc1 [Smittium mucronatum]|uniref:RNA-binding protein rnc1 n=1 Tax=Smittium mucronatum TaxID=133383 RepID=A0A1R0H1V2_9FUNG|nr:RNA-binding protein rnc1 [Smittium mucronatum]
MDFLKNVDEATNDFNSQFLNHESKLPETEISVVSYGAFEKKSFPRNSDSEDSMSTSAPSKSPMISPEIGSDSTQLTLRALVSTKEAGIIIGKSGKNVSDLRDLAQVKAGVSKVVPENHDRVLSISGSIDNVAHAYEIVAQNLFDNPPSNSASNFQSSSPDSFKKNSVVIRILISHNLMGTIIGKQGVKIKNIQDNSGARLIATKEMLPQSTERVVEIHGTVAQIKIAIFEIGKCLIEDSERGVGTVLYNPSARVPTVSSLSNPYVNNPRASVDFSSDFDNQSSNNYKYLRNRAFTTSVPNYNNNQDNMISSMPNPIQADLTFAYQNNNIPNLNNNRYLPPHLQQLGRFRSQSVSNNNQYQNRAAPEIYTQEISIPGDMVGCIIGKAGSRITEIRRISGSRIEIAKASDPDSGERLFTISGTSESNEKALYLLYGQLEAERERRLANARLAANLESLVDLTLTEN